MARTFEERSLSACLILTDFTVSTHDDYALKIASALFQNLLHPSCAGLSLLEGIIFTTNVVLPTKDSCGRIDILVNAIKRLFQSPTLSKMLLPCDLSRVYKYALYFWENVV